MNENYEIVNLVYAAKKDTKAADDLIKKYLPFIKAETARFLKHSPKEGEDDELGISMFAFYESIMAYKKGKGAFLRFAATAIRNRLIDYYRQEHRHNGMMSLEEPIGKEEDEKNLLEQIADEKNEMDKVSERLATKEEIADFSRQLLEYDLSLSDIADSCPKQERTLSACLKALEYAKQNPGILEQMTSSKKLPISQLAKGSGVEKKTLERHRKYMVAILLAYTNGFEIIRGHLCQLKREGGQTI
ncbi:MAG: sigma factor [Lachnospiraceae bacterium]